jgi:hypothetical protein
VLLHCSIQGSLDVKPASYMVQHILMTNLCDIHAIKLVCEKCHASMSFPLSGTHVPEQCFSCGRTIPSNALDSVLKQLEYIKTYLKSDQIDIYIEQNSTSH